MRELFLFAERFSIVLRREFAERTIVRFATVSVQRENLLAIC